MADTDYAELVRRLRSSSIWCPACGEVGAWTDGTDTDYWCQTCGTETEVALDVQTNFAAADALEALQTRVAKLEQHLTVERAHMLVLEQSILECADHSMWDPGLTFALRARARHLASPGSG